ncbi:MAG: phosphonate monoester hydrolase [Alphaproteobacteria bacterium]|nr:phosphonate monoester hydrolase [Alphaproteobacteria bacterium]
MSAIRNILFVMCDQLRADYLGCAGHPSLATPNIDALARRGVRFARAYCQSPVCGPSRMSFYTGRYMSSHGATWNNVPLSLAEWNLADHLRATGVRVALVGKTHMRADATGLARLDIPADSHVGHFLAECGFEAIERDDGLHPDPGADPDLAYNRYLREHGYAGANPWHDHANAAQGPGGEVLSGWLMRHARLPARVAEAHSETPYMTGRAIDFIRQMGEWPWCLHLSYIKPHWPYMAPAPYHRLYSANEVLSAKRHPGEREAPHPVLAAFMRHEDSRNFQSEEVRHHVIPTYMGLVKQIDDQFGRLMAELAAMGRLADTLIVFTSDHGDYLGDHWLGEKELFHEPSALIPLIVSHPGGEADATRGRVDDRLVEAIDLLPTFVEALGGSPAWHRLEGRSLLPLLEGRAVTWREAAFSEADYAFRPARLALGLAANEARAYMVRTEHWKYVLYERFRPQLFDLADDPDELRDLGGDAGHARIRGELHERLFEWLRGRRVRTTLSDDEVARRTGTARQRGILIGVW